ncbi:hypothetical protein [Paenibacillus albidus]|nr:hypothetical protein [Paenibacillus albidus]
MEQKLIREERILSRRMKVARIHERIVNAILNILDKGKRLLTV